MSDQPRLFGVAPSTVAPRQHHSPTSVAAAESIEQTLAHDLDNGRGIAVIYASAQRFVLAYEAHEAVMTRARELTEEASG